MSSIILWRDIFQITEEVCKHYGLSYGKIVPETRKQARCYGETYACDRCRNNPNVEEWNCTEKILYLRTHHLHKPNKPLATSTILRTLAHELAHLKVWGHGNAHRELEGQILEYIKELGYEV